MPDNRGLPQTCGSCSKVISRSKLYCDYCWNGYVKYVVFAFLCLCDVVLICLVVK